MSNIKNDEKILLLKKQISEKREKIDGIKRFTPITNCMLILSGESHNINTLTKDQLILILVVLTGYKNSATELGLLEEWKISGYNINLWIEDIKAKLEVLSRKEEEKKLKLMEDKLSQMLSNEKKIELEIDEIEAMLK